MTLIILDKMTVPFAVASIILENKQILLLKRSNAAVSCPGKWVCPGGSGKINETPEEAVIRETKEEINLDFVPTKLYNFQKKLSGEYSKFLGTFSGQPEILESEIQEFAWFSYEEAIKLDIGFNFSDTIESLKEGDLL